MCIERERLQVKKYEKQREQYETNKKRCTPSSDSDTEHGAKPHRKSPNDENRKNLADFHFDFLKLFCHA